MRFTQADPYVRCGLVWFAVAGSHDTLPLKLLFLAPPSLFHSSAFSFNKLPSARPVLPPPPARCLKASSTKATPFPSRRKSFPQLHSTNSLQQQQQLNISTRPSTSAGRRTLATLGALPWTIPATTVEWRSATSQLTNGLCAAVRQGSQVRDPTCAVRLLFQGQGSALLNL